jgi:hypothetical protein
MITTKTYRQLLRESLLVFGVILSYASPLEAQYQDNVTQDKQAIDALLLGEHLDSLPGDPKTYYSAGYETRARALQKLTRECIDFFQTEFPGPRFDVPLYVLDKNDWNEKLFGAPYAMPNYLPTNNLIVIGAEKNGLARLSGQPDDPVKSDSVVSGYDYVAVHEVGHYFFITLNNVRTPEHWVDEFLADYFLICYVKGNKVDLDLDKMALPKDQPHRTLDDFEKLYDKVGPQNYDWYQKEFIRFGLMLYPQFKTKLIKEMIANYSPKGDHTDAATLLKTLVPDTMEAWQKEMAFN